MTIVVVMGKIVSSKIKEINQIQIPDQEIVWPKRLVYCTLPRNELLCQLLWGIGSNGPKAIEKIKIL